MEVYGYLYLWHGWQKKKMRFQSASDVFKVVLIPHWWHTTGAKDHSFDS